MCSTIELQTVGRLAILYPEMTTQLVDRYLAPLTMLLQDSNTCPRVRGHAASALINLVNPDNCESDDIEKYLDPLLQALLYCLKAAPMEVRAPCLALLG